MTVTITPANVLDYLQEHGYTPNDAGPIRDQWFDRTDSLTGGPVTLRVILGDSRIAVHEFDRHMVCLWTATFTYETPVEVVFATLTAAEVAR